jgi:two-component SAPR family response regulator
MTAKVNVRCLGPFAVTVGPREVGPWRAGKARSLFQYLVVNRGRPVLREKLHEVLWPGSEWSPGSSSLKVAVHAVRQVLASSGLAAAPMVRLHDRGYLLDIEGIWVDAEEFESTMDSALTRSAQGDHAVALRLYRHAAQLYRGDFLDGETADWVVEHRGWIQGKALRAFTALRDDAYRRRDAGEVFGWCERILRVDPYHEPTYRVLMLTHGRLGELGRVRSWHAICVRRLREDLAVEPEAETEFVLRRFVGANHCAPVDPRLGEGGSRARVAAR